MEALKGSSEVVKSYDVYLQPNMSKNNLMPVLG
jgi:hypothetical protein